jgi:hypothetical protein
MVLGIESGLTVGRPRAAERGQRVGDHSDASLAAKDSHVERAALETRLRGQRQVLQATDLANDTVVTSEAGNFA